MYVPTGQGVPMNVETVAQETKIMKCVENGRDGGGGLGGGGGGGVGEEEEEEEEEDLFKADEEEEGGFLTYPSSCRHADMQTQRHLDMRACMRSVRVQHKQ